MHRTIHHVPQRNLSQEVELRETQIIHLPVRTAPKGHRVGPAVFSVDGCQARAFAQGDLLTGSLCQAAEALQD
jgi:hypothetical protein